MREESGGALLGTSPARAKEDLGALAFGAVDTVRWAILGTGGIASAMAGAFSEVEGAVLDAVGSRSLESAKAFAEEHGASKAYGSYDEAAADPDVDAVYVATTNDLHLANTLAAIATGKAVLCEKPLALSAAQGRRMADAAKQAGVFLMEAMWMRFQPFLAKLDDLVAAGRIGRVQFVSSNFGFPAAINPSPRLFDPELGGGALLDLGVYSLTLAQHLAGPPGSFEAVMDPAPTGVDAQLTVAARHAGGVMSASLVSFRGDLPGDAVVAGSDGRIRIHAPFHHSQRLTVEQGGEVQEEIDVGYEGSGLRFEVEEVHRCLAAGLLESDRMPLADSLAVMEWMDAIRERIGVTYPGE